MAFIPFSFHTPLCGLRLRRSFFFLPPPPLSSCFFLFFPFPLHRIGSSWLPPPCCFSFFFIAFRQLGSDRENSSPPPFRRRRGFFFFFPPFVHRFWLRFPGDEFHDVDGIVRSLVRLFQMIFALWLTRQLYFPPPLLDFSPCSNYRHCSQQAPHPPSSSFVGGGEPIAVPCSQDSAAFFSFLPSFTISLFPRWMDLSAAVIAPPRPGSPEKEDFLFPKCPLWYFRCFQL